MAIVYLAIGSNIGNREEHIQKAMSLLKENEEIEVLEVSDLIETEPEGVLDQPKFLNGAIKIETQILPIDLLTQLKTIERRCGRVKSDVVNGPRALDLDILFYDDVVIVEGKTLSVPHPRLTERFFVLKPLAQIAPDMIHPRIQKSVRELLEELTRDSPAQSQLA